MHSIPETVTILGGVHRSFYAGFWRRFAASAIDWIICFLIPAWLLVFAFGTIGADLVDTERNPLQRTLFQVWPLFLMLLVLTYFTYFWARGQSPGMMVLGIRLIYMKTGRSPSIWRALVRALLMLVLIISALLLLAASFSDPPVGGYSTTDIVILYSLALLFGGSILGYLWPIWDRRKQTLQDKVLGIIVVKWDFRISSMVGR